MARTGAVGMAETGAEGTVEMGATSTTGQVTAGIVVSVATTGSSKVSAIKRTDIQD